MSKPFRLMPRDGEIIKAVNDYQAVDIGHLLTLFWNSKSPGYKRVADLVNAGYLHEEFITQVKAVPGASPRVFTVTKLGAEVLAQTYGYSAPDINYLSEEVRNWKTCQTLLKTNLVRACIDRACRNNSQFTLTKWIPEKEFRREADTVVVNGKASPLYPDGFFVIETERLRSNNFLEVDNSTEGLKQFQSQMDIYQNYMLSGRYEARFKSKSLRVVVVTTTDKRLESLRKATLKAGGSERYWFTTFDRLNEQSVLTQPIWRRANKDEWLPLFVDGQSS